VGIYGSTALGIAGTIVLFRVLGPAQAGRFMIVWGVVDFLGLVFKMTSDEALVKYGFRYAAAEDWPRFHRLVRVTFAFETGCSTLAGGIVAGIAPFADSIFRHGTGLLVPMLLASLVLPLAAVESIGGTLLILRGRYDIRGALLSFAMGLRLIGFVIGTQHGVTGAVVGLVAAQAVSTVATAALGLVALQRFPKADPAPLGDDGHAVAKFVAQSSADTTLVSLRVWLAPLALGVMRGPVDVGLFRAAQSPQTSFSVLSAPVRMILLTEQTRDWEHGRPDAVFAGLRRYIAGTAVLMAVLVPPLVWFMPWLIRVVLGRDYLGATDAARFIVAAAAVQLVFGWTKTLPVTIGRPGLRVIAHAIESGVLLALIITFGRLWGVTGAGAAVLVSTLAYAGVWVALLNVIKADRKFPEGNSIG